MVGTFIGTLRLERRPTGDTSSHHCFKSTIYSALDASGLLPLYVLAKKSITPISDCIVAHIEGYFDYSPASGHVVHADDFTTITDDPGHSPAYLGATIGFTGTVHKTLPMDKRMIVEVKKQTAGDWMIGCDLRDYPNSVLSELGRGDTVHLLAKFVLLTRNTDGYTPLLLVRPHFVAPIVPYAPSTIYRPMVTQPLQPQSASPSPGSSYHRPSRKSCTKVLDSPVDPKVDGSTHSPPSSPVVKPITRPGHRITKRKRDSTGMAAAGPEELEEQEKGTPTLRPLKRARMQVRTSTITNSPRKITRSSINKRDD